MYNMQLTHLYISNGMEKKLRAYVNSLSMVMSQNIIVSIDSRDLTDNVLRSIAPSGPGYAYLCYEGALGACG